VKISSGTGGHEGAHRREPARFTASTITDAERHYQVTWAACAAIVAVETAAALATQPSGERASAAIWIDVLNECAKGFMQEEILSRPRPGDLSATMPAPGP
jgi:hypothetical protein